MQLIFKCFKIWLTTACLNGIANGLFLYFRKLLFPGFLPACITVFLFSLICALPAVLFMWEVLRSMQQNEIPADKIFYTALKTIVIVSIPVACVLYLMIFGKDINIEFLISIAIGFISILAAVFWHFKKIISFN